MTLAGIRTLLKRLDGEPADAIESETLECKSWDPSSPASQIRDAREAVVCLANARGGVIVLGVADGRRTRSEAIQGVGPIDAADLRRRIYDGTDPHILVEIEELIEPEGRLLVIRVPRGMPPHTTTEGVGKVRVGKECKPLTGTELMRLLVSAGERDFTAAPAEGASIADLDPVQIAALQRILASEGGKTDLAQQGPEEMLRNLGLVRDGDVTLAAILLLGGSPALARWLPQHEVVFLRYRAATRYDVRRDLKAPLLAVLDAMERLLAELLRLETIPTEGFRELTVPDVSWTSAREAVLNALVHRDYFLNQSVHVELRPGRLIVSSPGGFVGGVTAANILRHPPVRRNPHLASTLQTAGLVNRAGLGVDRIWEDLIRLGKGMPHYEADEGRVSLTLPLKTHEAFARFVAAETRKGRTLELDDLIALRSIIELGFLDRWSAAERLQLHEEAAAGRLVSLRERGYLAPSGRGRGTSYRLSPTISVLLRGRETAALDLPMDEEAVRRQVLAELSERGSLTNLDVRRMTGRSRAEVVRLMNVLRKRELVVLRGSGRGAHYGIGPKAKEGRDVRSRE